jgi:hypothetical protein
MPSILESAICADSTNGIRSSKVIHPSNLYTAGPGGSYDWDSTGQAGKGRMAITDVLPPNRVAMALQFEAPMKANNKVVFTLRPQDSNTEVTWEMTGTYGFAHKIMDVAFNFEKLIGGEFDKGLADLKSQAEAR